VRPPTTNPSVAAVAASVLQICCGARAGSSPSAGSAVGRRVGH
jgi:hypothetical protein